jgi:hypothetical protein
VGTLVGLTDGSGVGAVGKAVGDADGLIVGF